MRSFHWGRNQQGTGWLNDYLAGNPLSQLLYRCWRWAFVGLGCAAGCATQQPGHIVGPMHATGEMLTQAGDGVQEIVTGKPKTSRWFTPTNGGLAWHGKTTCPHGNCPNGACPNMVTGGAIPAASPATTLVQSQPITGFPANGIAIPQGMTFPAGTVISAGTPIQTGTIPAGAIPVGTIPGGTTATGTSLPVTTTIPAGTVPTTTAPKMFAPTANIAPPALPAPTAIPNQPSSIPQTSPQTTGTTPLKTASLPKLTAPPTHLSVSATSQSRPVNPIAASLNSTANQATQAISQTIAPANPSPATATAAPGGPTNWCTVRIRNISSKPVKKFNATVVAPADGQLVVKDTQTNQNISIAQCDVASDHPVNPGEELTATVGLITSNEQARHLHVQIRDALGGNQQAIQSRWQVTIDPAAAP